MYYTKYLDMFRAILCSSSGGQNCIFTASVIFTLCERLYSAPVESGLQSQRVAIPDAVKYNFDLLKMSIVLLETCRGI
jgi:hypothetical protein